MHHFIKSKKLAIATIVFGALMALLTLLHFQDTFACIDQYLRADMIYDPPLGLNLHYVHALSLEPNHLGGFGWTLKNLLDDFLPPLLLAYFFGNVAIDRHRYGLSSLLFSRYKSFKHAYLAEYRSVVLASMIVIFSSNVFQIIFGWILDISLKPFSSVNLRLNDLPSILFAVIRMTLYWALLNGLYYAIITLFSRGFRGLIVVPMILNILMALSGFPSPTRMSTVLGWRPDNLLVFIGYLVILVALSLGILYVSSRRFIRD